MAIRCADCMIMRPDAFVRVAHRRTESAARVFWCVALAKLFPANFGRFATEHPPQYVIEAGRVLRASAQLADGDEVAFLQSNDQLAPPPTVAVFVNCHAANCFV